jgi:hypothetical protein
VDRIEREFGDAVPYIEDAYRTIRALCGSPEHVARGDQNSLTRLAHGWRIAPHQ